MNTTGTEHSDLKVGASVRKLRKERGVTQKIAAEKIGLSVVSLGKFERGQRTSTSVLNLIKLADLYDVSLDELVGRKAQSH